MALPKRRTKRNNAMGEHRRLLMSMPLDVLIEIFLFLEPLDLLFLSRTSKVLRGFLLDRSKAFALWKNVISNIDGFPPCPDHMSAPAYTHLAFVPVCHGCFGPCETIEWQVRIRSCPNCFPKMTIPRSSVNRTSTYLDALRLPVAYSHYELHDRHDSPGVIVLDGMVSRSFSRLDWKLARSRKRPRNVSAQEFASQQNQYWESIVTHAELCRSWEYERLQEKAARLSSLRKQRVQFIQDELDELRWTKDIWSSSHKCEFLRLPEVRGFEPLTPAEWVTIRPSLVSWARNARKSLIRDLCATTFASVSFDIQRGDNSNSSLKIQPRGIDIATLPAARSILENEDLESDVALDTISDSLKKKLLRALPPAIKKWSSDIVEELEQLAREQLSLPARSKPSTLPSVIFRCKRCSRSSKCRSRFMFDQALSHDHLYRDKRSGTAKKPEMTPYDKVLAGFHIHPRDVQALQVDLTVSQRVENLIRRMGQNPSSATCETLCRSTVKVICSLCGPEKAVRMNFERALGHCLDTHIRDETTEIWTRAPARTQDIA